ncbi:MAG TPA: NAD(P)H dehydrogenase [Verrucomicrobia bacterium]|nr:MAG: NAD(P)H dehydrogenase [Lentisphaerae bacterium GWF2_57_35]HBA84415.1 NAD(P)H dehydrogenase [Verrucomicrobiota bacterium]
MKLSIILAHPDKTSFNHALAARVVNTLKQAGHAIRFHDLYKERFDSHLPAGEAGRETTLPPAIRRHCREIAEADGIVVVHPNWWGAPPAILKGWVDRVLRAGVAYRFVEGDMGEGVPEGLLKARAAIVLNTSNTRAEREFRIFGDPLQRIWKDCIFALCGVRLFRRRMFGVMVTSTVRQREAWLREAERLVLKAFPPCRTD